MKDDKNIPIEIWPIGGYSECGRNMTAVRVGDEFVILDMGLHMEKVAESDLEMHSLSPKELKIAGALPDDEMLKPLAKNIKAIVLSHAHLDHIGAVPKMIPNTYDTCPVIGTPFTMEVLKNIMKEEKYKYKNRFMVLNNGSTYKISNNITLEFVNITHSTPQTSMVVLHTPRGAIVYANDWKFDQHPVIGQKTDYKRLKELGRMNVLALISDTVRINDYSRTFSESLVKEMFNDLLFWLKGSKHALFITTFASHLARLSTILEIGRQINRIPVLIGRSMKAYISAGEKVNLVKFSSKYQVFGSKSKAAEMLKKIDGNREKYLVITTGCQGEPGSVLHSLANDQLPFHFVEDDQVIFSSSTIPTPINEANRAVVERQLRQRGVRVFTDVHVSGHGGREDLRDLIKMLKPKHYLPAHGGLMKLSSAAELAIEMGFELGKNVHVLSNGKVLRL